VFRDGRLVGTTRRMQEPGLDKHEWESQWGDLQERLADDPAMALAELDGLVARMLEARGLPLEERDGETETEPETIREFLEARRIMRLVEDGEDVSLGDIGFAATSYRELYELLLDRGLA
jgi:hypothetical protein